MKKAAAAYLGDIKFEENISQEEKADIIRSMTGDYMAGASQLAQFIVDEITEGTSLEDIKKLLLELDDVTAE